MQVHKSIVVCWILTMLTHFIFLYWSIMLHIIQWLTADHTHTPSKVWHETSKLQHCSLRLSLLSFTTCCSADRHTLLAVLSPALQQMELEIGNHPLHRKRVHKAPCFSLPFCTCCTVKSTSAPFYLPVKKPDGWESGHASQNHWPSSKCNLLITKYMIVWFYGRFY